MPTDSNRILDAICIYAEQEVKYRIGNPTGSPSDQHAYELKKQYYRDLLKHYRNKLNSPEKASRQYLKNEIRKLTIRSNPDLIDRLLYGQLSRWIRNFFTGDLKSINWHKNTVLQLQNRIGIEENMTQLSHIIKKAGFVQDLDPLLKKMIAQGLPQFHIRYSDIKNPNTDFILHFKHIDGSGAYQFDRFDVANRPTLKQFNNGEQQIWHTFNQNSDILFIASESAHLVSGRAVCKGESDKWYVMDKVNSTNPIQSQEFNLKGALNKLPLPQMSNTQLNNLIKTLKSGATKEITLNLNGEPDTYYLLAVPQSQTVRILDKQSRFIDADTIISKNKKQNEKLTKMVSHANDEVIYLDKTNSKSRRR